MEPGRLPFQQTPRCCSHSVSVHSLSPEFLEHLKVDYGNEGGEFIVVLILLGLPSIPPSVEAQNPFSSVYWPFTSPFVLNVDLPSFTHPPKACLWITQLSVPWSYGSEAPLEPPWIAFTPYCYNTDAVSASFLISINPIQSVFYFPRYLKLSGPLLAPFLILKQFHVFCQFDEYLRKK